MEAPSSFQQQYPLSPKKFTKKVLPSIFSSFFLSIFLSILLTTIVAMSVMLKTSVKNNSLTYSFGPTIVAFVLIFLAAWLGQIFLNAWYIKVYIKRYYYDLNDQFISIQKGVFSPREIHVQFQKIQDVYVDQDIWDRFFGLYDVHIASATTSSGGAAHIDGVNKDVAEYLKNTILGKITGGKPTTSNSSTPTQPGTMPNQPAKSANFSEDFSSKTYPIKGKWLVMSFFTQSLAFLLIVLFFGSQMLVESKYNPQMSSVYYFYLIVFILASLGPLIRLIIWKATYHFEFKPDFILISSGWISRHERQVPYRTIQDVSLSQSFMERLFGLSRVTIENASQGMNMPIRYGRSGFSLSDLTIVGQPYASGNKIVEALKSVLVSTNDSAVTGL